MTFKFTLHSTPATLEFETGSVEEGVNLLVEKSKPIGDFFALCLASHTGAIHQVEDEQDDPTAPKTSNKGRPKGSKNKPKNPPQAPDLAPIPDALDPAPMTNTTAGINPPAFVAPPAPASGGDPEPDQTGTATLAPPLPPAPPPPALTLAPKFTAFLKAKAEEYGPAYTATITTWLIDTVKLVQPGATWEEAIGVVGFQSDETLRPIAASWGVV